MSASSRTTLGRARRHDKIARWVVTLGGAVVIVSVLGILLLILGTTVPLFLPARSQWLAEAQLPGSLTAQGTVGLGMERSMDGQLLAAHLVGSDGFVTLLDMATGEVIERVECGQTVAPAPKQDGRYSKRTVRSICWPAAARASGRRWFRRRGASMPGRWAGGKGATGSWAT